MERKLEKAGKVVSVGGVTKSGGNAGKSASPSPIDNGDGVAPKKRISICFDNISYDVQSFF